MHTILIADDHPMFRAALQEALREVAPDARVLEAASEEQLTAIARQELSLTLALLDLAMPGSTGCSALHALRTTRPELPVLVISAQEHPSVVQQVYRAGAVGFVSKVASIETYAQAIRAVLAGSRWFKDAPGFAGQVDGAMAERVRLLSPPQQRVLALLAQGLLNKQIADHLGLAENTVKTHVAALLRKLGCRSRAQAAGLARWLSPVDASNAASNGTSVKGAT
ncbi:response regulator transcription factor [Dyella sp. ASV21]|uniref:response regulator n=1 Tax=Dyella sp. ASV21 TaxID=2795114 RepID=UPI0018EA4A7F|nr:response regulator transcription factor [Dyella sp. ASV21]